MFVPLLAIWLDGDGGKVATVPFTVQSLFTEAGATTAVFTVATVLRSLVNRLDPRWTAAVLATIIMLLGITVHDEKYTPANILVALVNAAVVYAAAIGVNNVTTNPRPAAAVVAAPEAPAPAQPAARRVRWFD